MEAALSRPVEATEGGSAYFGKASTSVSAISNQHQGFKIHSRFKGSNKGCQNINTGCQNMKGLGTRCNINGRSTSNLGLPQGCKVGLVSNKEYVIRGVRLHMEGRPGGYIGLVSLCVR